MKLKHIGYLLAASVVAFVMLLAVAFYQYTALNSRLLDTVLLLDKIGQASHEVQTEALSGKTYLGQAQSIIDQINQLSHSLRRKDLSEQEHNRLINLEISFVRIGRTLDHSLPDRTLPRPLLKQVHNETVKIKNASTALLPLVKTRIEREQTQSTYRMGIFYFGLCLCTIIALVFVSQSIIAPILRLSREIEGVQQGLRDNISPATSLNEIGSLATFTHNTISDIQSQCQSLSAYRRVMELLVATETLDELLHQTLQIVLSLQWLKIEDKGGIFLIDPKKPTTLVLKSAVNFNENILQSCSTVQFGNCICGRTAESRQLIHTSRLDELHDVSYPGMLDHGHYCVPLLAGQELLGVMIFYLPPGKDADPEEENFLTGLAGILSETIIRRRLEEQQTLISTAVTQAGEGVVITDRQGNIQYANPYMTELTGYSTEEIITSNARIFNSKQNDEQFYQQLWQTILAGIKWEGDLVNKKKDGSHYEEKMVITPVENDNKEITHFVAIKRDISKEKSLERQLMQSQKLEALGTLAGGIAHDFNNILSAIFGFTELAKLNTPSDSPAQNDLDQVLSGAHRARELAKHILTFSRKTAARTGPIRLSTILKEAVKLLRASIPTTIQIEQDIDLESGVISADPTQIHQVLMNLCTNAAQAMEEKGGTLSITLKNVSIKTVQHFTESDLDPGQYVELKVGDTGPGISPTIKNRIFDPFFTTKDVGKGTGMGLSVVHGIVEGHGGVLSVDSTPDVGTTFTIYFPRIADVEEEYEPKPDIPMGNEKILFIDDEIIIVDIAKRMLEMLGYTVKTYTDSQEALKDFQAEPEAFDLVISDQTMPHLTGYEMAQEIIRINPAIPVILCTGHSSQVNKKKALETGVSAFLLKPLKIEELATNIRQVLDSSIH